MKFKAIYALTKQDYSVNCVDFSGLTSDHVLRNFYPVLPCATVCFIFGGREWQIRHWLVVFGADPKPGL